MKCIFCSIINKEIPASIIYETEKVISFLDINPMTKGHSLVVPKDHFKSLEEIPENIWNELLTAFRKISNAIKRGLNATGYNILLNQGKTSGQEIEHIHFHILPSYPDSRFYKSINHISYREGEINEIQKLIKENL